MVSPLHLPSLPPLLRIWSLVPHFGLTVLPLLGCSGSPSPGSASPVEATTAEEALDPSKTQEDSSASENNPPQEDAPGTEDAEEASSGTSPDLNIASASTFPLADYKTFVRAWKAKDRQTLTRFSAKQGVFLLDNMGAFRRMRLVKSVPALLELEGEFDGARIKKLSLSESVEERPVPPSICEGTEAPALGVFLAGANGEFLKKQLENELEYEIETPAEVEKKRPSAERSAPAIQFIVADTKQSVSLYFGMVEGKFLLLAVDATVPCSA